jgi:hypothetical protein
MMAHEVLVTRRVEEVDLGVLPLERQHSGVDGDLALGFIRVEVGNRVAFLDLALASRHPGPKEHCFGESGLA